MQRFINYFIFEFKMEILAQNVRKLESLNDLDTLNQGDLINVVSKHYSNKRDKFESDECVLVYYEKNSVFLNFIKPRKDGIILETDVRIEDISRIKDGNLKLYSVLVYGGYEPKDKQYEPRYNLLKKLELI